MCRSTLIDLNPIERNNYPLMISLDKCNGTCNVFDDLSAKICSEQNKKQITCDCKCKFDSITIQVNGIIE